MCSCLAAAVSAWAVPATAASVYLGSCCHASTLTSTEIFQVVEVAVAAEFFSPITLSFRVEYTSKYKVSPKLWYLNKASELLNAFYMIIT